MKINPNLRRLALAWLLTFAGFAAGQEVDKPTNDFVGSSPARKIEMVKVLSAQEQKHISMELKRMLADGRFGKAPLKEALAYLGDQEVLQQLVREFIQDNGASPGLLAAMQNPRIIEMVAPEFFRKEPMELTGGDVVIIPRSFRAAELAVEILANSPAFHGDVINWAHIVHGLSWSEKRELVRPWWKANEQFFRKKSYKAVQAGPQPPRDASAAKR